MKNTLFIFPLLIAFSVVALSSCKKENNNEPEIPPASEGQTFKFYTNGTLRSADSITTNHMGDRIIIDYFSSDTPPFAFTGRLIIADSVMEGRSYPFNEACELYFKTSPANDGVFYKSVSGTYSVTGHNTSAGRIEITFYGTLDGFNPDASETGEHLSISNGHAVSFY